MRKPITDGLGRLLEERKAKVHKKAELEEKLRTNAAQRQKVIAESTGSEDTKALSQLELLTAHQAMTEGQLQLLDRELTGLKIHIQVEAEHVKGKALDKLREQQQKVVARLRRTLEAFYPEQRELDRVINEITAGRVPLPTELERIRKHIAGIGSFAGPEACPLVVAESVFGMVNRAFDQSIPEGE